MSRLPMFPLGTVLLPGAVLPLHVFEPRYRALVSDCLAGEPEFGVVLIERGREVGGGDVRRDVGTVARIAEVASLPDGRSALMTVGTRRITVRQWLPDDPVLATYHASALAPLGPDDQYQLLAAPGPGARLARLATYLGEAEDRLRFRIAR